MLCPYGFETDAQGCALCECKNPCKDVECPNGTECQVDDSACKPGEQCSPSTNCRKARAALGECAFGDPLTGAENRPLLCGTDTDKPNCPSGYECFVQQNAEYGLCCPQEQQNRAAECPQSVPADFRCDKKCEFDADCDVGMKCCDTSCGKACLSSRNSTLCEQQRRLARLFSEGVDAPGYIPQCDDDGQFQAKQCSTNGKVCWCVNSAGQQMSGSMGPAAAVICATKDRSSFARSKKLEEESHDCSLVMCNVLCEYGYKKDDRGCTQCECIDPCESKICEKDEECVIVKVSRHRRRALFSQDLLPWCSLHVVRVEALSIGTISGTKLTRESRIPGRAVYRFRVCSFRLVHQEIRSWPCVLFGRSSTERQRDGELRKCRTLR